MEQIEFSEIDKRIEPIELPKETKLAIRSSFIEFLTQVQEWEEKAKSIVVKSEMEVDKIAQARECRLFVKKIRTTANNKRRDLKEDSLKYSKAVQEAYNLIEEKIKPIEEHLMEQEKFAEIQKAKRIERLQKERVEMLSKYVEDASERNLGEMDEDVWTPYFFSKKEAWEKEQDRLKKEEKEREERIRIDNLHNSRKDTLINENLWQFREEWLESECLGELTSEKFEEIKNSLLKSKKEYDAEQEKIRKENERLRKEAEEREKKAKIEQEKREKEETERKAKEEAERKEREAKEAKEREAYQKEIEKERKEKEELAAKIKAQEEAERKANEEAERQKELEAKKGDSDKVSDLINDFELIKTKYSFKSKANQKMFDDVKQLIDKTILFIKK